RTKWDATPRTDQLCTSRRAPPLCASERTPILCLAGHVSRHFLGPVPLSKTRALSGRSLALEAQSRSWRAFCARKFRPLRPPLPPSHWSVQKPNVETLAARSCFPTRKARGKQLREILVLHRELRFARQCGEGPRCIIFWPGRRAAAIVICHWFSALCSG